MNTLSRSVRPAGPQAEIPRLLVECGQFVRHSRSLASMMPALLISGTASLLVSVLLHLLAVDVGNVALHGWLEGWLTLWPLLFPIIYLGSLMLRRARGLAARRMEYKQGLGYGDIAAITERVNAGHGFSVLRGLKPRSEYLA